MTRMLLPLPLLLTGCASLPPPQADGPRTGDTLVQHREITVPAGRQVYWIQDGQLGLTSLFAWRNPYCELRFAGTSADPRLLPPRRYEVSAVHYRTLIGASLPHRVAGPLLAGKPGTMPNRRCSRSPWSSDRPRAAAWNPWSAPSVPPCVTAAIPAGSSSTRLCRRI